MKILFVSKSAPARYKDLDCEILRRHFTVYRHDYTYNVFNIVSFMRNVRRVDLVLAWFASPWMACLSIFVPRSVKLVVVAGGYDVAHCEALGYGARSSFLTGWLTRRLLKRADCVLPVSKFNHAELMSWVRPRKVKMIYNAVDFPGFCVLADAPRRRRVLTVGAVEAFISKRKGHYHFIEIAKRMPDFEFVLVGKFMGEVIDELKALAPSNVRFSGFVSRQELLSEMLSASVYLQLSYHEAFGVSVAEAITCGCYPIVASRTALPEICLNVGDVVSKENTAEVVDCVRRAIVNESYRKVDAESVVREFSVERRETDLVEVLKEVVYGEA